MTRVVIWLGVVVLAVYASRFVVAMGGRFVALIPMWLWAMMGFGAVMWLLHKWNRHKRPVRIRVKVHTVPPHRRTPNSDIIDTEGEVVSQRRA